MLSIGKLVAGQERYYQQQIAQGLDDYYSGRGEASGRWVGAGAADLGLEGQVREGQLAALIGGRHPVSGEQLRERDTKVAAVDLTFSAPKSISVLFAVAPEPVSRALVECHEEAVEAALGYLEETAAFIRRREAGGRRFEPACGFVTAAFRHRMSRALDPQLHTHCVTANMAEGPDGKWTALHHPSLYRAAQTAGYLYQSHLRARVHERLGLTWGPVTKGAADLDAIPRGVLEEFSRRRHEMQRAEQNGGLGLDTKKRAEKAALSTRERKEYGVETHTWREEVHARAAEHGLDTSTVAGLIQDGTRRLENSQLLKQDPQAVRETDDALASPSGLTEKHNTFDDRAVLRGHAQAAQNGATTTELGSRSGRFATRNDVLPTTNGNMTTTELVAVEERLIVAAESRLGEGTARIPEARLQQVLAGGERDMTSEQRSVVNATISSGDGVQVIEALAGTGKTYAAGVLAHVYRTAGYEVLGVAPTGRAVRELTDQAGISSRTLTAAVLRIRNGIELPRHSVIVLDEAGMAGTRETAVLLAAAQRAGAKVIAIGDPGQLHSVQAGGWMRAIARRTRVLKLTQVMRQRDPAERRALSLLHAGVPEGWLAWAREHNRIALGGSDGTLYDALVEWQTAARKHGLQNAVLIARSNDTRTALNKHARETVRGWGALGEDREFGRTSFAVGDRVICRRNDRDLDVDNGTRGTVQAVHRNKIMLETDTGATRTLPARYAADHLEHAYALTGHGMQGGTVEWAGIVAVPHELTRGWSYTALSRARGQTRLFVLDETDGWTHHEQTHRDELAPGERATKPTTEQLAARVARYMATRDDEDLAIELLATIADHLTPISERAAQPRVTHQPPELGALIGERPAHPRLARRWDSVATALDDHLRQHHIDVARDGPLGPDQLASRSPLQRAAYQRRRRHLARDVNALRRDAGHDPHPDAESVASHPAGSPAPERRSRAPMR